MAKFILPVKCPNCGVITIQESEHRGEIEVFCGSCEVAEGKRFRFRVSMSEAYECSGYWRGICPNCYGHISSYIFSKQGVDYIFCGECFQLFPLGRAEIFEIRDVEGKVVKMDREREEKYMVRRI